MGAHLSFNDQVVQVFTLLSLTLNLLNQGPEVANILYCQGVERQHTTTKGIECKLNSPQKAWSVRSEAEFVAATKAIFNHS